MKKEVIRIYFWGVLNKNLQLYEYESVYCGNKN